MRDLMAELKELRLHGMATAWAELTAQGESNTASSKWLLEHLLEQEHTDRAMRSVSHQMNMAKLPMHRDLASFDFNASHCIKVTLRSCPKLMSSTLNSEYVRVGPDFNLA